MNDAFFRLRPLCAVLMSLIWPCTMNAGPAVGAEVPAGAQVEAVDSDGDGLPDAWEIKYFGNRSRGGADDQDRDTLSNLLEYEIGTNPTLADSNRDGQPDWVGIPGYLYQEKWPETEQPHPRDYYPRHLFDAPGETVFFHPGAAVKGKNEKFFRQRLRGRLIVPLTGEYEFAITANSWCELWLGENESRFSARRLAGLGTLPSMSSEPTKFGKFPDQLSRPVSLVAGREYYIEILHRSQTNSNNHVSVAWRPPGTEKLVVIPKESLRSWVPEAKDGDDNGILDAWSKRYSLGAGRQVAMEDPDNDGIANAVAYKLDCDPKAGVSVPDVLAWSRWYNPSGVKAPFFDIDKFRSSKAGDREPDFRCVASAAGMRLPSGEGQMVPTLDRLQGTITAPETGLYSFWIMGKASAELSISPDEHPFLKHSVACATLNSSHGLVRDGCRTIRSVPVWLEKGQPRFIDAFYAPVLGKQRVHISWMHHKTPIWKESSLAGGTVGTWVDRDNTMVASVRGPSSFGGVAGDGLFFRHVSIDGACEAICRLDSMRQLNQEAGGGLMLRSSTDPFAPFVTVTIDADRKFGFHSRTTVQGVESIKLTRPYQNTRFRLEDSVWLRLRSRAGTCVAYYSMDGVKWILVGETKIDLGEAIVAGPVAWGGRGKVPADVVFSNVVVSGLFPEEEIPAGVLSTPGIDKLDLDSDGLPDSWEREHKISSSIPTGDDGPQGDPDDDGFSNLQEYRLGGDPRQPGGFQGYLTREVWRQIHGSTVADLRNHSHFKEEPDQCDLVSQPDLQGGDGDQHYGQRLRGTITAPVTGTYRFWIAGDNGCSLSLSTGGDRKKLREIAALAGVGGESTKLHEWGKFPSQRSAEIELIEGAQYFLEVIHKESFGADHVSVAWEYRTPDGRTQPLEILPSRVLRSHVPDKDDLDDDNLPDKWEVQYGLNPGDNGRHDPVREGAAGDFDGDGLTNLEEYQIGTDPSKRDSDGDGVSDHDEIRIYGSDPVRDDVVAPVKDRDFSLGEVGSGSSGWINTPDGAIRSLSRQSTVTLTFHVDKPGIYLLELVAKAVAGNNYSPGIPVVAAVGTQEVGRTNVSTAGGTSRWLTPWLQPGNHSVTIKTLNYRLGQLLEISSLALYGHEGSDADGNGIPDWLELLMGRRSGIDSPLSSHVSPLCLEGTVRLGDSVAVRFSGGTIPARPSITGRWYADVPLDPSSSTKISLLRENGACATDHQMDWTALDPFAAPTRIALRIGDSLKLASGSMLEKNSAYRLLLDGAPLGPEPDGGFHILRFTKPGRHVLVATSNSSAGETSVKINIDVLAVDFGKPFNLASEFPRFWSLPDAGGEMDLESGPELVLKDVADVSGGGRTMLAHHIGDQAGESVVIARLPGRGTIAASTHVNVFRLIGSSGSRDARVVSVLSDGTRVVEFSFMIDGIIPDDLSIRVELLVPDAVFPSGDTAIHITRADFDDEGVARFIVYKSPGQGVARICHEISVYPEDSPSDAGNH